MESANTTVRRRTGFADLPAEVTASILDHLISDIDIDHPEDLQRWSYNKPSKFRTPITTVTKPRPYHNDPILCAGQRLNSNVKVTLRARLNEQSQWQTGDLTVMIPRRWNELLHSGLFHDRDMAFVGRIMNVEVTCMRTRYAPYIVYGPDSRTESAVRDLLTQMQQIAIYDLRLHAIHISPENLACHLPRLRCLQVFHEGMTPWPQPHNGPAFIGPHMDPRALHTVTEKEIQALCTTGALPKDLSALIDARDDTLDYELRWNDPRAPMSTGRIRRRVQLTGWMGETNHCILFKCIAEGSKGWLGSRYAYVAVALDLYHMGGWGIKGVAVSGDCLPDSDIWASLLHFDL